MNFRRAALFVARVGFGYAVAVMAAVTGTLVFIALPTVLPDDGAWGSIYGFMRDWSSAFAFGVMTTAPTALPGFVVAVALAQKHRWQRWIAFALAGALNAIPSQLFFHAYGGGGAWLPLHVLLACLPGGFAGGLAYWLAAGRSLANRRPAV